MIRGLKWGGLVLLVLAGGAGTAPALAETLRLLSWPGYAPEEVRARFTRETGHAVEVTLSNNAEMLAKLRATDGAGFDLVQPSLDQVLPVQSEYGLYRPIDPARIDPALFEPGILAAARQYATEEGRLYALPHVWGTSGLVVDRRQAGEVRDYTDLCRPGMKGRMALPRDRQSLTAFAFALGVDPFALYGDPEAYGAALQDVEAQLQRCADGIGLFWSGGDDLLAAFRSGEVVAALAWDGAAWRLQADMPDVRFVTPLAGALGWIDGFALPRQGKADAAAYAWIRFVLRAEIAADIAKATGRMSASAEALADPTSPVRGRFRQAYPGSTIRNIRWFAPAGPDALAAEQAVLDRLPSASSE